MVLHAGRPDSSASSEALEALCRIYWYPLYAYSRRQGFAVEEAQDLTQEFFAKLMEKNYLGLADRQRGRFRAFLITAFKCFLANEWDRACAAKRGKGQRPLSFDEMTAEQRYRLEPVDHLTADQLYDRRWALALIERARRQLRDHYASGNKLGRFELLQSYLPGEQASLSQAEIARELGLSENAVKQEVFRLKKLYGEILRAEVAQTVVHSDDVTEELHYLIDVVCRQ
jgi:RNA polymerase sigma factor (sigma-70 family)